MTGAKAPALSEEDVADFRKVFQLFDIDGTGSIDASELEQAMKGLGLQNFSWADAREIIASIDTNKDGGIDFNEFLQLMTQTNKHEEQDVHKELIEAFKVFDKDGSGTISPLELRQVLITQGQRYTAEEINEMIAQVDLDGDGLINYQEFILLMTNSS